MPITVTEKFESRKSTKGDNPPSSSAELVYTVRGTNDDLAARNAAETTWIPTRTDNPGIIVIQVGQTAPPSPSSPCAAIFDRWNRAGSVAPGCASQISQALAACCSGGSVNNACVNQVARQNAECSGRIPSKDDFIRACTADCVSSYGGDVRLPGRCVAWSSAEVPVAERTVRTKPLDYGVLANLPSHVQARPEGPHKPGNPKLRQERCRSLHHSRDGGIVRVLGWRICKLS